jgi:hypothetical protein
MEGMIVAEVLMSSSPPPFTQNGRELYPHHCRWATSLMPPCLALPDPIKGTATLVTTSTTHSRCPHFFSAPPSAAPLSSSQRCHPSPPLAQLSHPAAQCCMGWGPHRSPLPPHEVAARIRAPQRRQAHTLASSGWSSVCGPWWTESAADPQARGHGPRLFPLRNNSKFYNPRGFV